MVFTLQVQAIRDLGGDFRIWFTIRRFLFLILSWDFPMSSTKGYILIICFSHFAKVELVFFIKIFTTSQFSLIISPLALHFREFIFEHRPFSNEHFPLLTLITISLICIPFIIKETLSHICPCLNSFRIWINVWLLF